MSAATIAADEHAEQFAPGTFGRLIVLEVIKRIRPDSVTEDEQDELDQLRRRHHTPITFAEEVAWEREFGAKAESGRPAREVAALRREKLRWLSRRYGLPYLSVKSAIER